MRFLQFCPYLFIWLMCPFIFSQETNDKDPDGEKKPEFSFSYQVDKHSTDGEPAQANVFISTNGKMVTLPQGSSSILMTGQGDEHDHHKKTITVFTAKGKDHDGHPFIMEFNPNHGFLGIESVELTEELRVHFGAPQNTGIMIGRVTEVGPAEQAGLQVGDILTHLDEKPITNSAHLLKVLMEKKPGEEINASIWRDGETIETSVVLGELDVKEHFFSNQNAMIDVMFEPTNHSSFNFSTSNQGDGPVVEWVEMDPTHMSKQIEELQKKIIELEKRILKQKKENN